MSVVSRVHQQLQEPSRETCVFKLAYTGFVTQLISCENYSKQQIYPEKVFRNILQRRTGEKMCISRQVHKAGHIIHTMKNVF